MTSPVKRPAVTYQRGPRKVPTTETFSDISCASLLKNPDVVLQQKINDLLFSKENNNNLMSSSAVEDEFDSAYHESSANAKKVHDLVQVGETRRFVDEIDYLLEGLEASGPKALETVRSSLQEIVGKCFKKTGEVDLAFGMKLKSHGALETIFDTLNLIKNDSIIFDNLLLLICGLLYDVRRLDFFFKPQLAIKLAKHCCDCFSDFKIVSKLKRTQVITNLGEGIIDWTDEDIFTYVGIWILFKWTFSSITTLKSDTSFFDLLLEEDDLIQKLINLIPKNPKEIGEKSATLLDCLLNRRTFILTEFDDQLTELFTKIIEEFGDNLIFMKLAVSISGSKIGMTLPVNFYFKTIQNLMKIIGEDGEEEDVVVLGLSCLINLVDRCDDSVMDEFRYQRFMGSDTKLGTVTDTGDTTYTTTTEYTTTTSATTTATSATSTSLLQYLARLYSKKKSQGQKSLLALALGFICRQNQTNVQVMLKEISCDCVNDLKDQIHSIASKFLLDSDKNTEDDFTDVMIKERLGEIIVTFKP